MPLLTSGSSTGRSALENWIWPPSRSLSAGATPFRARGWSVMLGFGVDHLADDVHRRSGPGGGVAELLGLGLGDQLGKRLGRIIGADHDQHRHRADEGDRRERFHRVVAQLAAAQRRADDMGARACEQQRLAVGRARAPPARSPARRPRRRLFSITISVFSRVCMSEATSRASVSTGPPAANGTTTLIDLGLRRARPAKAAAPATRSENADHRHILSLSRSSMPVSDQPNRAMPRSHQRSAGGRAVQHLGDAGARAGGGVGRQRVERKKAVRAISRLGCGGAGLAEVAHHVDRHVVAPRIERMEEHAVQHRRPGQLDVALLRKFARQRLQQRLAGLDPAAGQMPAVGVGVLDQEHAAVADRAPGRARRASARARTANRNATAG